MLPASARRSAIVVAVNLTFGLTAVVLPSLTHAATASHHPAAAVPSHAPDVQRVRTTRDQLVRNSGFNEDRRFWSTSGESKPRLRVTHPGFRGGHAARLVVQRRGVGDVQEGLRAGNVHVNDHYAVSADVRASGVRADVTLELRMYRGSTFVGQHTARIALHNRAWHVLQLNWTSHRSDVHLAVAVRSASSGAQRGFSVDNVRVVRTREVTATTPAPAPTNPPAPAPTASAPAAPNPAPTSSTPPAPAPTSSAPASPAPTPTVAAPGPVGSPPAPAPTSSAPGSSGCTVSATLVPSCGLWWGAYKHRDGTESWADSVTNLQTQVNQSFNIIYRYHDFSGAGGAGVFPDAFDSQLYASGHILLEDWASKIFATGTQLQWSDITAGKYDASVIDPEAERIKAFGHPIMLSFDHEMDNRVGKAGQPADYVAAYKHIYARFAALGVTNVIWVWTITGYSGHD
jgi:hypothetical protein